MGFSQSILFSITTYVATTLFIYHSILLFIMSHGSRSRKIVAFTNLMWGIFYLVLSIHDYLAIEFTTYPVFSIKTLVLSNFFICIMYLYPFEIVHPNKFNVKNICFLLLPSFAITSSYFGILWLKGEGIEDLRTFSELVNSIGNFNVWYRFFILGCNLVYSFTLLKLIYRYKIECTERKEAGILTIPKSDMAWMNYYFQMLLVLVILYVVTIFWGSKWNVVIYNTIIIGCFSVLFYKGVEHTHTTPLAIQETSIIEGEHTGNSEAITEKAEPDSETEDDEFLETAVVDTRNYSFETKIPYYVKAITQWMEKEQPYLNKDFKLTDISEVIPLNRSYLSRIFNEGFHQSFSEVVREYRIKYAQKLIAERPQLPLYEVAKRSGFTSYTTLTRSFQKVTGMIPTRFKSEL